MESFWKSPHESNNSFWFKSVDFGSRGSDQRKMSDRGFGEEGSTQVSGKGSTWNPKAGESAGPGFVKGRSCTEGGGRSLLRREWSEE